MQVKGGALRWKWEGVNVLFPHSMQSQWARNHRVMNRVAIIYMEDEELLIPPPQPCDHFTRPVP